MKWPTKPIVYSNANITVDPHESGLIAAWGMKPQGPTIPDLGPNGYHGTIYSNVAKSDSLLGNSCWFSGVSDNPSTAWEVGIDCGMESVSFNAFTISTWIRPDTISANYAAIISKGFASGVDREWTIARFANRIYFFIRHFDNAGYGYARVNNVLNAGCLYHMGVTFDGNAVARIYINTIDNSYIAAACEGVYPGAGTVPVWIGSTWGTDNIMFDGVIGLTKIYNDEKSHEWMVEDFNRGKSAATLGGWGVRESIGDEGGVIGNQLSDTVFRFADTGGRFKIVTETVNGSEVKAIKCTTAGLLQAPSTTFHQTPGEMAYGTYDFWVNKADNGSDMLLSTAFTGAGYIVKIASNGSLSLVEFPVTELIDGGTLDFDTWYHIRIVRNSTDSSFMMFVNGTYVGTATDDTTTSSTTSILELGVDDMVVYGSLQGNMSYSKGLI